MLALALQIPAIQRRRDRVGLVLKFLLLSRLSNTRKKHLNTLAYKQAPGSSSNLTYCVCGFLSISKTLGDAAAAPVA